MKLIATLMLVCAAMLLVVPVARADSLGVDFSSPGSQNGSSVWSLGYEFTANNSATVVALGTFDYAQDGFAQAQQVGLWSSTQVLLASTFVDNSDPLQGYWRFNPISPVTLTAGSTYYVASQGGEGYTFYTSGFMVNPNITYIQDAYHYNANSSNSPLAFPDTTDGIGAGSGGAFFGGNIEFGSAVPEPSAIVMAAIAGVFGLGYYQWRRRQRA